MMSAALDPRIVGARGQEWPVLPEPEYRPLHRAILTALGGVAGLRLLDVGCGVGQLLRAAELGGALAAGVDPAAELLEIARWGLPDADLRVGEATDLPFDNGCFDVAVSTDGATCCLPELVRVTRPGGRVVVGGVVRPAGCWAEAFAEQLSGLVPGRETRLDDPTIRLAAAGLVLDATGDVRFTTSYPTKTAAWASMLGGAHLMTAIHEVGEQPVRQAFCAAIAPVVHRDGTVDLPKAFSYAIAKTPA
jgi:SAM-dependent methyltransferase